MPDKSKYLLENEELCDLELDGLSIIQHKNGYRFTLDAVVLSNLVYVRKNEVVLDLGTGSAVIPLILSAKSEASKIIGVEIMPEAANMAKRSVELNNLTDKVFIVEEDIKNIRALPMLSKCDAVTANPPYFTYEKDKNFMVSANDIVASAKFEIYACMEDFIYAAKQLLKFGGRFYMVQKCDRLTDAMVLLRHYGLEPKEITFIKPKPSKPADTFVVCALKGGKPSVRVDTLTCYDEDGQMTSTLKQMYNK